MTEVQEQVEPQEFFSDEHRESYVAALVREKEGYDRRAAAAGSKNDEGEESYARGRADQVQAQLDRLASAAKKPSQRSERRGGSKPAGDE